MFQGFEGPAGTGKTSRLIDAASVWVDEHSLEPFQRVLALTYMHPSRRRLEGRLAQKPTLRGRCVSMTIDSFALNIVRRWRSLAREIKCSEGDFEATCDACGQLLEEPSIARWVSATFPIVLIDEAQELTQERLRIVRALASNVALFVAADEFQCLDSNVDTGLFMKWFRSGAVVSLDVIHRTKQKGLLDAALALRDGGRPPRAGPGLKITYEFRNNMPFAVGHALNRARLAGDGALIVGPGGKDWANALAERLRGGLATKAQRVPPLHLYWEPRPHDEVAGALRHLGEIEQIDRSGFRDRLLSIATPPHWIDDALYAVDRAYHVVGQVMWTREQIVDLLNKKAAIHNAHGYHPRHGIPIMTIQGAKNRQFGHVVVLWPPGVRGQPDELRRLLYNALTRAQTRCTVFIRTKPSLSAAPF